eukprot:scaffold27185_cov55-Phaeocystis_antarctica.AAC.1
MAKHLRCYVSLCSGAADAISVALAMATLVSMKLRAADAISMKLAGPGMPPSLASAVSSCLL